MAGSMSECCYRAEDIFSSRGDVDNDVCVIANGHIKRFLLAEETRQMRKVRTKANGQLQQLEN